MKKLLILLIFCIGCASTPPKEPRPPKPTNCNQVPMVWWGERGEDPSQTDLWKCYDWILEAR